MTRAFRFFIVAAVFALTACTVYAAPSAPARADIPHTTREQAFTNAPDPIYPQEARQQRIGGKGIYRLKMHPKTRSVMHVTILRSTGSKLLDEAAIRALSQWRLRRSALNDPVDHIDVPVTFTP